MCVATLVNREGPHGASCYTLAQNNLRVTPPVIPHCGTVGRNADQVAESLVHRHLSTAKPKVTGRYSNQTRGGKWEPVLEASSPTTAFDNQWKSHYLLNEWPVEPLQDALERRGLLPELPRSLRVGRDQCVLGEGSVPVIHAACPTSRGSPGLPAPSVVK